MKSLFLVLVIVLALFPSIAGGQKTELQYAKEYDLKVAYLFNIAKYARWAQPELSKSAITFCFFKNNPLHEQLNVLTSRSVKNKKTKITFIKNIEYSDNCHIVFASKKNNTQKLLKHSIEKGSILVTDTSKIGLIQLHEQGNFVRMKIDMSLAKQAQVSFSSQLLKVSEIVNGDINDER